MDKPTKTFLITFPLDHVFPKCRAEFTQVKITPDLCTAEISTTLNDKRIAKIFGPFMDNPTILKPVAKRTVEIKKEKKDKLLDYYFYFPNREPEGLTKWYHAQAEDFSDALARAPRHQWRKGCMFPKSRCLQEQKPEWLQEFKRAHLEGRVREI